MPSRIIGESPPLLMKILNLSLAGISFALTALGLEIDWQYIALVVGSTFAGSLLLGFFRPEKTFGERVRKIAMSQVAGFIFGSAIVAWRAMETPAYISVTYCVTSMVALIFLRSLVGLTESNAGSLTTTLIQRIFNVKLDQGPDKARGTRRQGKSGIHISETPGDGPPTVVISDHAKPDEVRVIEQTEVKRP